MKKFLAMLLGTALLLSPAARAFADENADAKNDQTNAAKQSVYDFKVETIDGKEVKLDQYKGDVLLIVNVASKCGLTDRNYKELEPLYQKYKDQGLRILAFPANNFMGQEPGSNLEIKQFCSKNYDVTFDLFAKVSVKGDDICPLYHYLTNHPNPAVAGPVAWNFQKYLVGRDGEVIAMFSPKTPPSDKELVAAIEKALAATPSASDG